MKYTFSKMFEEKEERGKHLEVRTIMQPGSEFFPYEGEGLYERWVRQMNTEYEDLTEKEKDSDREWAKKLLGLLEDKRLDDQVDWDNSTGQANFEPADYRKG